MRRLNEKEESIKKIKETGNFPTLTGVNGEAITLDEKALELLERYFSGDEVLFRSDYFATKLWSEEDIANRMEELGYEVTDDAVNDVIAAGGSWDGLTEIDDSEWNCIDWVIEDTLGEP